MQCALRLCALLWLLPASSFAGPWRLIWQDEFAGPPRSAPDPAKWAYDRGGNGWGNNERETYTDRRENSFLDGDGHLVIQALRAADGSYASARLKTRGQFSVRYGRIEARMKLPQGQGIWPAFWMLGDNVDQVGWPLCGEIDIMENIGKEPSTVHGTIHGPGYSGGKSIGQPFSFPSTINPAKSFHLYAVEWSPEKIAFSVDDQTYFTFTPASLPAETHWVYDHPFFLLLNVAVGGKWPGDPDETTVFPQQMLVDWVRVYQQEEVDPTRPGPSPPVGLPHTSGGPER